MIAHMISFWLGTFALLANAMKRSHSGNLGPRAQRQNNVIQRAILNRPDLIPPVPADLIQSLPIEIVHHQIMPNSNVSAILSLAMTAKYNYETIMTIFKSFYGDKQAVIYDELLKSKKDSRFFMLLRHAFISVWPTSTNCMDRFSLKDSLNALLFSASINMIGNQGRGTRCAPLPIFTKNHHVDEFNYVSGTSSSAIAVLNSHAHTSVVISAEMILEVPKETLLAYTRNMLDLFGPEPFYWIRENDPMLLKQLDHFITLFDLEDFFGPESMPQTQIIVLQKLVGSGLEACLDYIFEKQSFRWIRNDRPILELMLDRAESQQMEKLVAFLKKINLNDFVRVLCESKKLSDTILFEIFQATRIPYTLKTFLTMIDCGRPIKEEWIRIGHSEINEVLSSYNPKTKKYKVKRPEDCRRLMEDVWFVAHARGLGDDQLLGLLEIFRGNTLHNLLHLSLQLGKSDTVLLGITKSMECMDFAFMTDAPRNHTIPTHILPHILRKCFQGCDLLKLIPDEKKLIDAITFIEKSGLWTDSFSLGSVLVFEMRAPRKNVLQTILDLAAENDFWSLSTQEIPQDTNYKACTGILEYLMVLPTEKLINSLSGIFVQSHWHTISHMIIKVLLTRPDGFIQLMNHEDPDMPRIVEELIFPAWNARFPEKPDALENGYNLDFNFFELIAELSLEKVELTMFLYYLGMKLLKQAAQDDYVELKVPSCFARRQRDITKEVLETALMVLELEELEELVSRTEDALILGMIQAEMTKR